MQFRTLLDWLLMNDHPRDLGSLAWAQRTRGRVTAEERAWLQRAVVEGAAGAAAHTDDRVAERLRRVDLAKVRVPDSTLVAEAIEHVTAVSPDSLVNHCYRTFFWGALLAQADGVGDYDAEELFLAAMLHDLGCVKPYRCADSTVCCFAVEGAEAALGFLETRGFALTRARSVAEAIVLHTNTFGVDPRYGSVAVYLHAGAACDVVGARGPELPPSEVAELLRRYPGLDFRQLFSRFLQEEVTLRPDSRMGVVTHAMAMAEAERGDIYPWANQE